MKMHSKAILFALFATATAAVGCSSDTMSTTGSGGKSGGATGGSGSPSAGVVLTVSDTGWVDTSTNSLGIQGAWYAYGDATDCVAAGHAATDCSVITKPASTGFAAVAGNKLCTAGTAAKVINGTNGMPDYSGIWGTGIGIDLNTTGGANSTKSPYNATAKGVTGIEFTIDNLPLGGLRVEFPTPATTSGSAYWNGKTSNTSPVVTGVNTIKWADVSGPMYLASPPAFDPTMILSVQFHVPTGTSGSSAFDYCISNLKMLTN